MWPFFEKQKKDQETPEVTRSNGNEKPRRPMKFSKLVEDMGDFHDLKEHDTAMKFWLPEPVSEALEEMSSLNGHSMSEGLRQLFVTHCYGIYAFQVMNEAIPGLFRDPEPPMFSRRVSEPPPGKKRIDTYWVPELGKNVAPIKVWIPRRLRQDLQSLADHVGIKLSQYVREIVISRLLGHGTLPMRPEMLQAEPLPTIDDWCEDREIPKHQIEVHDRGNHPLGEWRFEWVDE